MVIFLKGLRIMSRRHLLMVVLGFMLSGCGRFAMPPVVDSLRLAWKGVPDTPISRDQIDRLPYASIYAKAGQGPRSLLVLGRYDQEDLHWISADRGVLVTRNGRLVKTVGFPTDLIETIMVDKDPIISGQLDLPPDATYRRTVDIMPGTHFQVQVTSRFEKLGKQVIVILGKEYETLVIRELAEAPVLGWKFENTYWADLHSGFIWRSIQHYAPDLPPIEIEVLKPAS